MKPGSVFRSMRNSRKYDTVKGNYVLKSNVPFWLPIASNITVMNGSGSSKLPHSNYPPVGQDKLAKSSLFNC